MAFGRDGYLRMASGLARSIRLYNAEVPLAVISDRDSSSLRRWFDIIIPLKPELGPGLAHKLNLDRYSPFERTLFIDADFLVFDNVDRLWRYFDDNNPFGLFGRYMKTGEVHYAIEDAAKCMAKLGLSRMVMTNTGVLYFDKSETAKQVFHTARAVAQQAEDLGMKRHPAGFFNDEPIFGVAVELVGLPIITRTDAFTLGSFGTDGMERIDVRRKRSRHSMVGLDFEPVAIHFNVDSQKSRIYDRELRRLEFGSWLGQTRLPDLVTSALWRRRAQRLEGLSSVDVVTHVLRGSLARVLRWLAVRPPLLDWVPFAFYLRLLKPDFNGIMAWVVRRSGKPFSVVQIGSNDGQTDDPLYSTLSDPCFDVEGILVEPVPELYERLTDNYREKAGLRLLNVAIAEANGVRPFFWVVPKPGDPWWVDQLGSFNRDVILSHANAVPHIEDRVQVLDVPSRTLESLVSEYGIKRIDFLHIDAEGFDFEILKTINFRTSWSPRFILYEQKHLGDDCAAAKALLQRARYRVFDFGTDVFAYRRRFAGRP